MTVEIMCFTKVFYVTALYCIRVRGLHLVCMFFFVYDLSKPLKYIYRKNIYIYIYIIDIII